MLRLRLLACPIVSAMAPCRGALVAEAGASVILSANCAMNVPRPTITAANISMLRIRLHLFDEPYLTTPDAIARSGEPVEGCFFAKRMSEALTQRMRSPGGRAKRALRSITPAESPQGISQVPRGLTRRVGIALAGSSGHGWRG